MAFHDMVDYDKRDQFSALIKFGYALNTIRADIGQEDNDDLREETLGARDKSFEWLTFGLELGVENIKAEFTYFNLRGDDQVLGLTNPRILTTITFTGGFTPFTSKD